MRLDGYGDRRPAQLSGGQRQRVALARALVNRPEVLLLDEPLGALDLKLREEMQVELKAIQREVGITFIFVTHDQEEALTMSDRIAVFNDGRIEQVGTPAEVYEQPATPFVAGFVGTSNLLDGGRGHAVCSARRASFSIRPEKIRVAEPDAGAGDTDEHGADGIVARSSIVGSRSRAASSTSTSGGRAGRHPAEPAPPLRPTSTPGAGAQVQLVWRARPCPRRRGSLSHEITSPRNTRSWRTAMKSTATAGRARRQRASSRSLAVAARAAAAPGAAAAGRTCPPKAAMATALGQGRGRAQHHRLGRLRRGRLATTRRSTGCTRSRSRPAARSTSRSATPPTRWSR